MGAFSRLPATGSCSSTPCGRSATAAAAWIAYVQLASVVVVGG
jgi:hypothetical protein